MNGKALVLRCVAHDMSSSRNRKTGKMFYWPASGPVSCDDWNRAAVCGYGLHGWLWGMGSIDSCDYWNFSDNKWLVIEVDVDDIVHLDGKVKFPKGTVVLCGPRDAAVEYIVRHSQMELRGEWDAYTRSKSALPSNAIMFAHITEKGHNAIVRVGSYGNAVVGDYGSAFAEEYGTATAGDWGTASAGNRGTAKVGNDGIARAKDRGTATAGNDGFASTEARGRSVAGKYGKAITGAYGTAIVGYRGTAMAGVNGTAAAGNLGTIMIRFWDSKLCMNEWIMGKIGEGGLKPDVLYQLNEEGKFVEKGL